jgi:hypothetical protein
MQKLIAKIYEIQKELTPVLKSEANPYYKSKYFDVNMAIEHLMPLLTKHGVVVLQPLSNLDGAPAIKTILADKESGEIMDDTTPLPKIDDPQKMGSAVTYFRRYALTSLFLVQGEEDDDANATVKPQNKPQVQTPTQAQKTQPSAPQGVWDGNWKSYVIPFGKHKGKTMEQVDKDNPDYLVWLSAQDNTNPDVVKALGEWSNALPSGLDK